jgi:phosphoglucomutase
VLTGFKYIADKIVQFDKTKKSEFLLGFEESYGYLIKPFAHDKDSIQATVLMAELAAYYYNQGKTLGDALDDLYEEFGYVIEDTRSVNFPGESGLAEMQKLMTKFRSKAPKTIGKIAIDSVSDYQLRLTKIINIKSKDYGKTTKITLPEANVIKYWLEDGSWVALRPSGTEPKLKIYVGVVGSDIDDAQNKLGLIEGNLDSLAGIK